MSDFDRTAGGHVSGGTAVFQRVAPRAGGLLAGLVGLGVLVGWALDVPWLKAVLPNLPAEKPNAAVCFVLLGAAVWLGSGAVPTLRAVRVARACAVLAGAVALLTIAQYLGGTDFGVDQLLWREPIGTPGTSHPGRMGLNTAIGLVLVAVALLAKLRATANAQRLSDACGVAVLVAALVAFLGYLYRAAALRGIGSYTDMALHSAVMLLLFPLAVAAVPPHGPVMSIALRGTPGAMMVRRLLPSYSGAMILLGVLRLWGQDAGLFGLEEGVGGMVAASVALFGAATGWTAAAMDRGAALQRRWEAALEESERRYRSLVNATFDGIVVTEGGIIREANPGLAAMFDYEVAELIGRSVQDLVAEESHPLVAEPDASGREGPYALVGRRKDGRIIHLEGVTRVLGDAPGRRRIVALRDVTAQRRLEDQLRQAQKLEAVGRLAGGVAHDFNNLLTVISSYAELVHQDLPPGDARRVDLERIRAATASAAGLTRQLLAFSRQQNLEPKRLVLNGIVASAENLLRPLIGAGIELRTALAEDLLPITADPRQVERIIINLAVNARDAMPAKGTLTIGTANADIGATSPEGHGVMPPGRYVRLWLRDSGHGMDEETQRRIFEPFFTTKEQGTGLGLATVYGIVKQSNGYIWVQSEPGRGTTFEIYFPAAETG